MGWLARDTRGRVGSCGMERCGAGDKKSLNKKLEGRGACQELNSHDMTLLGSVSKCIIRNSTNPPSPPIH